MTTTLNSTSLTAEASAAPPKEKSNFLYSFSLLPREERDAMHRIYEFCRYTDDLVDEDIVVPEYDARATGPRVTSDDRSPATDRSSNISVSEKKRLRLNWWRNEVERCYDGTSTHPVLKNLHKVIARFKIPKQYLLTLIDGVEMDLVRNRYETFEDLKEYCYAVASIVGLICIEVFGYKHEQTRDYAVNLGYALQLTNILRDIKQDTEKGRIYLPLEDLKRFGCSEADLLAGIYSRQFIQLMKFETARAREFYAAARRELRKDERFTMFAAEIMDAIYFRLLRKIELAVDAATLVADRSNEYAIFGKRIKVSTPHKLLIVARMTSNPKFWLNRFF